MNNVIYYWERNVNDSFSIKDSSLHEIDDNGEFRNILKELKAKVSLNLRSEELNIQDSYFKEMLLKYLSEPNKEKIENFQKSASHLSYLYRKSIAPKSRNRNDTIIGVLLYSDILIIIYSISKFKNNLVFKQNLIENLKLRLNSKNLLRADFVQLIDADIRLSLYIKNTDIRKTHARFWGIELLDLEKQKPKVWQRDGNTCQKCGKKLVEIMIKILIMKF